MNYKKHTGTERKIHKASGSRPQRELQYVVRFQNQGKTWAVYDDNHVLIEGGFTKERAEDCARKLNEEHERMLEIYSDTLNK